MKDEFFNSYCKNGLSNIYKISSGKTVDEFSKEWSQKYKNYVYKLMNEVGSFCEIHHIDFDCFRKRNKLFALSIEKFYNHPDKEFLVTMLDDAMHKEMDNNNKLYEELKNNKNFKDNAQLYEYNYYFIIDIRDDLTKIYFQTKDEAYNQNEETNIKKFCLMSNEERKENFRNAISSVNENKGLK